VEERKETEGEGKGKGRGGNGKGRGGEVENDLTHPLSQIPGYATAYKYLFRTYSSDVLPRECFWYHIKTVKSTKLVLGLLNK